jgi:hypothetical protein
MPPYYEIFVRLVAPYHAVLVHFPIAIWTTVPLIVFFRAVSDSPLARAGDRILVPILLLSIVSGIAAYLSGFMIFPLEAAGASPLIRNHIVTASWSLACWIGFPCHALDKWRNRLAGNQTLGDARAGVPGDHSDCDHGHAGRAHCGKSHHGGACHSVARLGCISHLLRSGCNALAHSRGHHRAAGTRLVGEQTVRLSFFHNLLCLPCKEEICGGLETMIGCHDPV